MAEVEKCHTSYKVNKIQSSPGPSLSSRHDIVQCLQERVPEWEHLNASLLLQSPVQNQTRGSPPGDPARTRSKLHSFTSWNNLTGSAYFSEGYSGYLRGGDIAVPPQQADHHDGWQSVQTPANFPLLWSELETGFWSMFLVCLCIVFTCLIVKNKVFIKLLQNTLRLQLYIGCCCCEIFK